MIQQKVMVPDPRRFDFSHVTDPTARMLLEQMRAMLEPLQQALEHQASIIEKLSAENAELKRMLFGKKSERMPPISRELNRRRKGIDPDRSRQESQKKRQRNAKKKKELPTEDVDHEVDEGDLVCPHCGGTCFRDLGEGEVSYEYEYVPGRFVRRRHIRHKKSCLCGSYIITAPGPLRVTEGTQYGPAFHAQVVVAKLADSLPLYRQAKQLQRHGLPICRSTLGDLFHRTGQLLEPLRDRMLELIKQQPYVNADETPIQVLAPEKTRRSYIWTFIGAQMAAYVYSPNRSGETPQSVLSDSQGFLQVDGYSGYNNVCVPDKRTRVGCWAHLRRYFWRAQTTAPRESEWILNKITELYTVEYLAAEKGILGTKKHLALRKMCSAPLIEELELYIEDEKAEHLPEGPMGKAITYATNNWKSLIHFLDDPQISLDNNLSERLLRIIALGRKNFLFLGNDEAGDHLAVLQSLVSSCELNGVNPFDYLKDVLIRIAQGHPQNCIDELLPHSWAAIDSS